MTMHPAVGLECMLEGSLGFLAAGAAPPLVAASLAFSPVKLIGLVIWFYLCLYCVQCVPGNALIRRRYKTPACIFSLFAGPLLFLVLFVVDLKRSSHRHDNVVELLKHQFTGLIARIRSRRFGAAEDDSKITLLDSEGTALEQMWGHYGLKQEDRHVLELTQQVIGSALEHGASDILIDPKDQAMYAIRLRIDGVLRPVRELDADTCKPLINSIKVVAGMDIAERRRPQDGAFMAQQGKRTVSFRVASAGVLYGEKLAVRVLNQGAASMTLDDVGIETKQGALIQRAIARPSGMVLICGPTGSGKTTTLYAMLSQIDPYTRNVITVEDPIEAQLPEASQIEINAKAGITFAKALRSILRQDPDVICVGEIRDEETAEIGLRAAQTGHLVLATIHCDSNTAALIRLLDLGVSRMLMSSGLSLLISQRLMRLLCEDCKRPAQLSPAQVASFKKNKINSDHIFRPGGCDNCGGTGYLGRIAVCDLMPITEQLKSDIAKRESLLMDLESQGDKRDRSNLRKYALQKVVAGITSLEELKRVVG